MLLLSCSVNTEAAGGFIETAFDGKIFCWDASHRLHHQSLFSLTELSFVHYPTAMFLYFTIKA